MPFQSCVNFEKFQAHLLDTAEARAELVQLVIPHECEYCHGKGSMKIHGWYSRNAIDPYEEKTYLLLVPLFICTNCGHSIRVLPYELHPWCQYLSKTVRKAVESRLRDGIWRSDVRSYKRLARKWHSSFMLRVENCATLSCGDPLKAFRQYQPATMVRLAQEKLLALQADGRRCILMIDEAHLLRNDVFAQIHILAQHPSSSSPLFSLMLCGQEELAERLEHPNARPLLSRIADGYFVPPIERDDFDGYIEHHLRLAGAKTRIFDDLGLDTLWQTSSANLRSIGNNALATLQWAANNDMRTVTAECVRRSQRRLWGQRAQDAREESVLSMPDYSAARR